MSLTPSQRILRARAAAYALHSQVDSKAHTAKARKGFLARFEREVDPEGKLSPEERQRRAQAALKAHMAALALKSSRARSRDAA